MAAQAFAHTIRVAESDIDPLGHVNNVAFVRYVQEIAAAHWRSVAPADILTDYTWVVRRHEVEYFRPGMPGDELLVRTWVGEPSGATWERFTEITRPADGQVLVKARTVWVLLDAATGRPRRVDARMTSLLADFTSPASPSSPA
jgi:acyl-CoA thioester hydrolase